MADEKEYRFAGQEGSYAAWRPTWPAEFAEHTLKQAGITRTQAGWNGTVRGGPPKILCVGAGQGADAAAFKRLGCLVILVDPSSAMLEKARGNMATIKQGAAYFVLGTGIDLGLKGLLVDVVLAAQAAHTFKDSFNGSFKDELMQKLRSDGKDAQAAQTLATGAEELARASWSDVLPDDGQSRVAIWYYNPDPRLDSSKVLHSILQDHSASYKASKSPLVDADFFDPRHFQPWITATELAKPQAVSSLIPLETLHLRRDDISDWLGSYSFCPKDAGDKEGVVTALQEGWFDRFADNNGVVAIPYVGFIAQGPLRSGAFDMKLVSDPADRPANLPNPLATVNCAPVAPLDDLRLANPKQAAAPAARIGQEF